MNLKESYKNGSFYVVQWEIKYLLNKLQRLVSSHRKSVLYCYSKFKNNGRSFCSESDFE